MVGYFVCRMALPLLTAFYLDAPRLSKKFMVPLCLRGRSRHYSTLRYLGIEVDDAIEIAEKRDI